MDRTLRLMMLALLLAAPLAQAQQAASAVDPGKKLFEQKCAMCHNATGMGTGLLARRMAPAVAELEKRQDLTVAFVTRAARSGILNMPMITKGDVSDEQLAKIASYLAHGRP